MNDGHSVSPTVKLELNFVPLDPEDPNTLPWQYYRERKPLRSEREFAMLAVLFFVDAELCAGFYTLNGVFHDPVTGLTYRGPRLNPLAGAPLPPLNGQVTHWCYIPSTKHPAFK